MSEVMRNICPNCGGPTRLATDTYEQSCASCNRIAELEAERAAMLNWLKRIQKNQNWSDLGEFLASIEGGNDETTT